MIVLRRPGGSLILRLERLSTSNSPDLRVYLSHVPASSDLHAYRTGFIDLGALKGIRGSAGPMLATSWAKNSLTSVPPER